MNRSCSVAVRARVAAKVSLTSVLTISMFLSGSPFALAASLAGQADDATPTSAYAEKAATANGSSPEEEPLSSTWADDIDDMLAAGDYQDGEAIALVAPAAGSDPEASVAALSDEGDDAAASDAPAEESLLDSASEELFQTTGEVYEETFDTSLPDEALDGAQELAALSDDDSDGDVAVQAADVDVYALLVQKDGVSTEQILRELANDPRVLTAEPNYVNKIADDDSDALASSTPKTDATDGSDEQAAGTSTTEDETAATASASASVDGNATGDDDGGNADKGGTAGTGEADGSGDDTKSTAEGVTPDANETVTGKDVGDGTPFQWAYNSTTGNAGDIHKSAFTTKLENWNNAQMVNSAEVIAIVDTGIDADHPDLKGVMHDMSAYMSKIGGGKYGYGATGDDETDSSDVHLHGTHVAGMAAAQWNGFGVSGAANGAKLISVRVGTEYGSVSESAILKGYAYIERALDAGVNIRAINDSWGAPYGTYAICLAMEAVGRKGAISIVSAGNDSDNIDESTVSSRYFSNSDYAVIVDSAAMDGTRSAFSNYGKTSTDVFAPGSHILSTIPSNKQIFVPEMTGRKNNAVYYTFDNEDTKKVTAYAGTSVAGDATEVGSTKTSAAGYDASGVFELTANDLKKCLDSTEAYYDVSLKVPVDGESLNELSNIGATLACATKDEVTLSLWMTVEAQDASGKATAVDMNNAVTTGGLNPNEWVSVNMNVASVLQQEVGEGAKLSVYTDTDGTRYIVLHMRLVPYDVEQVKNTSLLIDCMGAGNKVVSYAYLDGTSMAAPCVTGLASVAACQMAGYKDHDAASAAALAQTIKASVDTFDGQFKEECTSGGMIDASKIASVAAREPVIDAATLVEPEKDGDDSFVTITGANFGTEQGKVTFGGKSAKVKSWSDTKIQIVCPSGLLSGRIECEVTTAAGKSCSHAETYRFTKNVSDAEVPTFEEKIELPDAFNTSTVYNEMIALDGSIYVFIAEEYNPDTVTAQNVNNMEAIYKNVWRYDIEAGTWSQAQSLPARVGNVSATLWNGKLLVMGAGESDCAGGLTAKKLFSLDPATGKWTDLSDKVAADDVPCQASIVNVGDRLLLIGGSTLVDNDDGSKSIKDLGADNIRSFDLETGAVKVLGTGLRRSNLGQEHLYANIQTALCGNKLYVFGGAMRSGAVCGQDVIECITLADDGSIKVEKIADSNDHKSDVLPKASSYDAANYGVAAIKDGVVIAGRRTAEGYDATESAIGHLQDDTFLLKNGASRFESVGKRVYTTNVTYSRALAYRGKLYVIGHDFENSAEPIMRATAVETLEVPGDVVRKKDDEKKDDEKKDETKKDEEGDTSDKTDKTNKTDDTAKKTTTVKRVVSVLPATGDAGLMAAAIAAVAAAGLLLAGRRLRQTR